MSVCPSVCLCVCREFEGATEQTSWQEEHYGATQAKGHLQR